MHLLQLPECLLSSLQFCQTKYKYVCVCVSVYFCFQMLLFFQKFDQFVIIESSLSTYAEQVCVYQYIILSKLYMIFQECDLSNIFLIQLQLQIIQLSSGKEMKHSVHTLSKYSSKSRIIAPFYTVYMCSIQLYRADLVCQFSRTVEGTIFMIFHFLFYFIYEKLCALREMYSMYLFICALWKKYLSCICASFFCGLFRFVTYITISRLFQYNYFVSLLQFKPYNALPVSDFIRKPPTYRSNDLSILRSHNN